jgi:hypothetical protein
MPAGLAAKAIVSIVEGVVSEIASYEPVITQPALKPAHQIYAEGLIAVVNQQQAHLQDQWTKQHDETVARVGVDGIKQYADQIEQATALVSKSYYPHLTAGYIPLAPSRSVELETPHARYTGEGRGVPSFHGPRFVSQIRSGEIFIELQAWDTAPSAMRIVRTVVPELSSKVLARLNDPAETQGHSLGTLPYTRLVMEVTTTGGPARVVYDRGSGTFDIPDYPHYSRMFCKEIAKSAGNRADRRGPLDFRTMSSPPSMLELDGATLLYASVASRPLSELQFQA